MHVVIDASARQHRQNRRSVAYQDGGTDGPASVLRHTVRARAPAHTHIQRWGESEKKRGEEQSREMEEDGGRRRERGQETERDATVSPGKFRSWWTSVHPPLHVPAGALSLKCLGQQPVKGRTSGRGASLPA